MELIYALFVCLAFFLLIIGLRVLSSRGSGGVGDLLKRTFSSSNTSLIATLLFLLAGLAIFFWGIYSPTGGSPSLVQVNSWSREHWLSLLALLGIGAILIEINAAALGKAAGVLQTVLIGVMFMLFIGFPVWTWLITPSQQQKIAEQICPDISAYQTRRCMLSSEWSNWIKLGDGPEANGKNFCIFPMVKFERQDRNGTTYWRFKISDGRAEIKYQLFPKNQECPVTLE